MRMPREQILGYAKRGCWCKNKYDCERVQMVFCGRRDVACNVSTRNACTHDACTRNAYTWVPRDVACNVSTCNACTHDACTRVPRDVACNVSTVGGMVHEICRSANWRDC
jgi:hypothetical protein